MDASPNQVSEVEFEQLLFAAAQCKRNFPVLTGKKELENSMSNDLLLDEGSRPIKE